MSDAAPIVGHITEILSDQQLNSWLKGKIDNLRHDPVNRLLTYRKTSEPDSKILYQVPEDRAAHWGDSHRRYLAGHQ